MKKLLSYFFGILVLLSSCQKDEDNAFDQSPDQRLNEVLAQYQAALLGSPNGWKATIVPETGATYNFFLRFDNQNRVKMFSDWDTATAGTARESSYRLKALQQPSLLFDTYSYLHILSDPDPRVNIGVEPGVPGQGLKIDFEYAIDSVTADQIVLTGRFNNTKLRLTKATAQEAAAWESGQWAKPLLLEKIQTIPVYFKRLMVGGQAFDLHVDSYRRLITFTWVNSAGNSRFFTTPYSYGPNSIVFNTVNGGTVSFNSFTNIAWDEAAKVLSLNVNNTPTTIAGATAPAPADKNAPQRWRQAAVSQGTYYGTFGFTVDGNFDALGVTNVADALVYFPQVNISGNGPFDLLAYLDGNEAYGHTLSAPPNFTADGRVIFTQVGTFRTIPADAANMVASTLAKMTDPAGFYLVQINETTYDMVSANDARSWMRWFLQ